jgi:hypothetical protein
MRHSLRRIVPVQRSEPWKSVVQFESDGGNKQATSWDGGNKQAIQVLALPQLLTREEKKEVASATRRWLPSYLSVTHWALHKATVVVTVAVVPCRVERMQCIQHWQAKLAKAWGMHAHCEAHTAASMKKCAHLK